MPQGGIEPEKVTTPIQLVAAWFATLVLLVTAFLAAGTTTDEPAWLPVLYGSAAVGVVPFFAWLVFRLQTRHRPELLEDIYYAKYKADSAKLRDFRPENAPGAERATVTDPQALATLREEIYRER